MKKKFPFGCSIIVLSVALIYTFRFSYVAECQDIERTQDISGQQIAFEVIPTGKEIIREETDDFQDKKVDSHWWKAGITEYELIENIMTKPVEIETTIATEEVETTKVTTQSTTAETSETTKQTTQETTEETTKQTSEETTIETTEQTAEETLEETTQTEQTKSPSSNDSWGNLTVKDVYTGKTITDSAYDIVCEAVHNEIGSSMQSETIKAQAIATYSYIKFYNNKGTTPTIALKKYPSQKIKDCVSAVSGLAAYYNGSVALTTYFASSAGSTANCKDVWGTSYPYLVSVESKYDSQDMNYGRTQTYSESQVKDKLENSFGISLSSNPENWITIQSRLSGNLVGTVSIDGQTTTTGRKLREKVFGFGIRSSSFDVSYSNGTFTFTTYGYGHGVGMPQNGADLYAYNDGWNYEQILTHYYTGIEIK